MLYKTTCGTLSQLTWQQVRKTEAQSQSMVPLHWYSEDVLLPLSQKPRKHQKRRHFEVATLLGLEHFRYPTKKLLVTTGS